MAYRQAVERVCRGVSTPAETERARRNDDSSQKAQHEKRSQEHIRGGTEKVEADQETEIGTTQ